MTDACNCPRTVTGTVEVERIFTFILELLISHHPCRGAGTFTCLTVTSSTRHISPNFLAYHWHIPPIQQSTSQLGMGDVTGHILYGDRVRDMWKIKAGDASTVDHCPFWP